MTDNVLKPLLLGRGVEAPMPVILLGALGGHGDQRNPWPDDEIGQPHVPAGGAFFLIQRGIGKPLSESIPILCLGMDKQVPYLLGFLALYH